MLGSPDPGEEDDSEQASVGDHSVVAGGGGWIRCRHVDVEETRAASSGRRAGGVFGPGQPTATTG